VLAVPVARLASPEAGEGALPVPLRPESPQENPAQGNGGLGLPAGIVSVLALEAHAVTAVVPGRMTPGMPGHDEDDPCGDCDDACDMEEQ
jgi:hypothetical protein